MKSFLVGNGESIIASQLNAMRDDTTGAALLVAHQKLGAIVLGTAPSNGQTITFTVNGSAVVVMAVTGTPTNPNDVKAPGTAAGFVANLINFLRRPDVTNANQIAATSANQQLLQYVAYALDGGTTTIAPFSLNNAQNAPLTSFSASATVTGASWTAQTMKLFVEPGTYYIGGTQVKFFGSSTPTVTAPTTNPRIDLLTIDTSGTLAWVTGTPASSPVPPAYPLGKIPICELYNVVGETALYDLQNQQSGQGYIQADVRPFGSLTQVASNASKNGYGSVSAAGTVTIAHGLGRTPIQVHLILASNTSGSGSFNSLAFAVYNGSNQSNIQFVPANNSSGVSAGGVGVGISGSGGTIVITFDATNIYFAVTYAGTAFQMNYVWDAI